MCLQGVLGSVVLGSSRGRALGGNVCLAETAVNNKVMAVDEARLVAGKEDDSVGLLNGLTEAAGREVDLAAVALGLVITEPVLEERGVEGSRAEGVEAESLAGVDHGKLASKGEDGTLGGCVGELGSSSAHEGDKGRRVDDGALGLVVAAEGEHGVLAAEPDALDVDGLGQVPDLLGGVDGVVVLGVHDAGVVEHDVHAAPGIERLDHGLDLVFLGDVTLLKEAHVMY